MAVNPFDKYGIKEVADVTFYHINDNTKKPDYPVLFLDSLKTSTIEQTAENVSARGGKGNPELISWDYGKEITVTLEDALFSAKSMAIMFGGGTVASISDTKIMKSEYFTPTKAVSAISESSLTGAGWQKQVVVSGKGYNKINPHFFDSTGADVTTMLANERYICTYDVAVDGSVITISGDSFPGTYYVTGDTYARSAATGNDEFFQFIIPKAKVNSENTITLEAEGDPSVFNLSLRVLRPENAADGMMKLIQYTLHGTGTNNPEVLNSTIFHNHDLNLTPEDNNIGATT